MNKLLSRSLRQWFAGLTLMLAAQASHALCIQPVCYCGVTTTGVAFGQYNPLLNQAVDSTGNVKVSCVGVGVSIDYTIALSTGSSSSYTMRTMKYGSYPLNYNLFVDSDRTRVWSNVSPNNIASGNISLNVLGIGPANDHTIFGRLMSGQQSAVPSAPSAYTDTITVTLTYN